MSIQRIDWQGICNKRFIWNPSNRECEYDKSCALGEYLDYQNCKCRKKLMDTLVEECSENIDRNEMIYNRTLNDYEKVYISCKIYIVFLVKLFIIFSLVLKKIYWNSNLLDPEMGNIKQVNIKKLLTFFNDIRNIKNFASKLPKIDKKSDKTLKFIRLYTSQ